MYTTGHAVISSKMTVLHVVVAKSVQPSVTKALGYLGIHTRCSNIHTVMSVSAIP